MTYKQIETSREVRLWISQIVIPAIAIGVTAMNIPEVRAAATNKVEEVKRLYRQKFNK